MTYCLQNIDIPPTLDENQNETTEPGQHASDQGQGSSELDQGHSNQGQGESQEDKDHVGFSLGDDSDDSACDNNSDTDNDNSATCDRKQDAQEEMMNSAKCTESDEETEFRGAKSDYQFLHRNHSFSEERWLKYERQEDELAFHVRNKQLHKRVEELKQLCDIVEDLNSGQLVHNVLGLQFDLLQFKVGGCPFAEIISERENL